MLQYQTIEDAINNCKVEYTAFIVGVKEKEVTIVKLEENRWYLKIPLDGNSVEKKIIDSGFSKEECGFHSDYRKNGMLIRVNKNYITVHGKITQGMDLLEEIMK